MLHELMLNEMDLLYRTGDSRFNAGHFQYIQIIEDLSLHTGFTHINIVCEHDNRRYGVAGVVTPEIRANTNELSIAIRSMLLMMYVDIMLLQQNDAWNVTLTRRYYSPEPADPKACWKKCGF